MANQRLPIGMADGAHGQNGSHLPQNGEIQMANGFDKKFSGEIALKGSELDLSLLKM